METLGIKKTFDSGVTFEIKKDEQGNMFICLSGGALAPLLAIANLPSLDLPTDTNDMLKLHHLLGAGISLSRAISE